MEIQTLKVTKREQLGKGNAGRSRRDGFVPAVVYGLQTESVSLTVDARELEILLQGKQGEHAIVELEVEGQPDLNGPALMKEVQRHPVSEHLVHADLLRIDLTKKIHIMVPVRLEGVAPGVIEGGVIDHQSREIEVACFPLEVPEAIIASVAELEIGGNLHVSDLVVPEGIEVLTDGDRAVAAVHAPRVVLEAEPEVDELAEGEEAEGEEGEEGKTEGAEGEEGGDGDEKDKKDKKD